MNVKHYANDGTRLTDCCGAYSEVNADDGHLFCRACYKAVAPGEGDGSEVRPGTPPSPDDMVVMRRGDRDALAARVEDLEDEVAGLKVDKADLERYYADARRERSEAETGETDALARVARLEAALETALGVLEDAAQGCATAQHDANVVAAVLAARAALAEGA